MATPTLPVVTNGTAASGSGTNIGVSRPGRRGVLICNTSAAETIYLFGDATTGFPIVAGATLPLDYTGVINVFSASGSGTVSMIEAFE